MFDLHLDKMKITSRIVSFPFSFAPPCFTMELSSLPDKNLLV